MSICLDVLPCFLFFRLRGAVMATDSAMSIAYRSDWDIIFLKVFIRGLKNPAPRVGLPLTCEPPVHTNSWGFHFRTRGLVCSIAVFVCEFSGAGVSV
jgi:hypothetical protein